MDQTTAKAISDAVVAGLTAAKDVGNGWQIAVYIIVGVFAVGGSIAVALINKAANKAANDNKLAIAHAAEIEAKNTKIAEDATELRKGARDRQIQLLEHKIDDAMRTASAIGAKHDKHLAEHKNNDTAMQALLRNIGDRLGVIERNTVERKEFADLHEKVNATNTNVVKLMATLEERGRREHVQ